jgi:hypothetical protein
MIPENQYDIVNYFLGLKRSYADQRNPYEMKWRQALAAVHMTDDLDQTYQGNSNVKSPVMKWKVRGIVSRLMRVLFNHQPFGRIEGDSEEIRVWNDYIFNKQLPRIQFKTAFRRHLTQKAILGTSVSKITQEYDEKLLSYSLDKASSRPTNIVDDTYFRPLILTEFYTDVSKENLQDSAANIHSTTVQFEELRKLSKKLVKYAYSDGTEETKEEDGVYFNLDLLNWNGDNMTPEQQTYLELLGYSKANQKVFMKGLKDVKKSGYISVDECYGKYWYTDDNGDEQYEELLVTIANGAILIRCECTPFRHKKFVRPFIAGKFDPVLGCFYGDSNVILGQNLLMELNATRSQAVDAKTRSIANMWYEDVSKNVVWNGRWTPGGTVRGAGQNGLTPIINPYLGSVSINDSNLIQRDLDQLWSLSPVQEGTSDARDIPGTATGTMAIISQNDLPLNEIIDETIENEIKPFLEMLYERDLTYKEIKDIAGDKDIKDISLDEVEITILGSNELNNELAHQGGWMQFLQVAQQVPPIAQRLDWKYVADQLLRSFGIKDLEEGLWIPEEIVQQIQKQQQEQQAAQQQALQQAREQELQDYERKVAIDTEAAMVKDQAKGYSDVMLKSMGKKSGPATPSE